jgi:hypothetical protein
MCPSGMATVVASCYLGVILLGPRVKHRVVRRTNATGSNGAVDGPACFTARRTWLQGLPSVARSTLTDVLWAARCAAHPAC